MFWIILFVAGFFYINPFLWIVVYVGLFLYVKPRLDMHFRICDYLREEEKRREANKESQPWGS